MSKHWSDLSPDEKETAIRPLAARGLTTREIAASLSKLFGAVRRAGVMSICNRRGIPLAHDRAAGMRLRAAEAAGKTGGKTGGDVPDETPVPYARSERTSHAARAGMSMDARAALKHRSCRPGGPVTILDLTARTCRWPVWADTEAAEAGGTYCGAAVEPGASFCDQHRLLAYAPAADPKRAHVRGSK